MTTPIQPESNDLAIASLILGILSLTGLGPLTGIPAIITGWMALRKNQHNRGMAIAGLITGALSIFFALLIGLFFLLLFILGAFAASAHEAGPGNYDGLDNPTDSSLYQQRA